MSISKTRQKLVEVARELFARRGLEATTMNDIAIASKRGRRTLYTYFRNKEDLYNAVIQAELERLSEKMDEVVCLPIDPEQKLIQLIHTHLNVIKETVGRNGSLRAEFFRNIWGVEKVRRTFDHEERAMLRRVIEEGIQIGRFEVLNIDLMTEVIHYSLKGLEVPYIYDSLGFGVSDEEAEAFICDIIRRCLGRVTSPPPPL